MQVNKFSAVKKLIVVGLIAGGIAACSTDTTPAPQKLSRNIEAVPSNTKISVSSLQSYPVDKDHLSTQEGRYTVITDVYDSADNRKLIPAGATISGTYINDGNSCRIEWKAIYANNDVNAGSQNAVPISKVTLPTPCKATVGVKTNDVFEILFGPKGS